MTAEDKRKKITLCLDKWLFNMEAGKRFADYLRIFQIHRVGIYGYGMLGRHLVRELQGDNFYIAWVMDRKVSGDDIYSDVARPDDFDKLEDVDIAIVATISDMEEIEALLLKFVTGKIISVEELINSIDKWGNQN